MCKRRLLGLLLLSTGLAGAQALEGAKVTALSGQVQVRVDRLWKALKVGEQVAQDALLRLGEGAHVSLRYRSDGHREEVQGPVEVTVGHALGNSHVTTYGFQNRPLELPHSGGLDAVGGNIANASGRPSSLLRQSAGAAPPPQAAPLDRAMMPGAPISRPFILEPQVPPLSLAWQGGSAPSLVSSLPPDQLRVGSFEGEAVVLEDEEEVGRLMVRAHQPVDFSGLKLSEDTIYLVKLMEGDNAVTTLSFRLLSDAEQAELASLQQQASVSAGQRQGRLDRLCALGQYHLAAQEGKLWLSEQPEPSPYLLQLVYDLNRDVLHDAKQTQYWSDWAEARQLPLDR